MEMTVPGLSSLRIRVMCLVVGIMAAGTYGPRANAEPAATCVKPNDVEMVQLINRWQAAFKSGNAGQLATLYAPDATVIVDKDGRTLNGRDAVQAYFKDFLAKRPMLSIRPSTFGAGCGTADIKGPVVFRITGERKGTRQLLGGSYEIVFALRDGTWLITRHNLAADKRGIGEAFEAKN
jgi:uncharacterized protein (TIGR02246 family)